MARNPADSAARLRFAALLAGHLARGTRPAKAKGEPWTDAAFAAEVESSREENDFVSPRSVSNWRKGKSLPAEIEPILRALFGPTDRHAEARAVLFEAFRAARNEKRAETIGQAERDPAGATWVVQNDQLAMDRTTGPTDATAAADTLRHQLQAAIRAIAAELADEAGRLANTRTWGSLSKTAAAFQALLDGDPLRMPGRLGDAYALLLRLGRFLETDIRVQRDGASMDGPLAADIHGLLTDLVRTAAPWLRGFPTVAAWDDEAGKALVRPELFQPAREFTRIAREQQAIPAQDAAEVELLAEAADPHDYQGQKAGNRAVGDATNLLLTVAGTIAAFLSGAIAADFATRSQLVQRLGATLAAAEAPIDAFAATMQADLRQALQALVKEGRRLAREGVTPAPTHTFPLWADDGGEDAFGKWVSFSVTGADGTRVEQRMRWCPPGRFMMGSPDDEEGRYPDEGPRHEVVFARGFWMFETACRQELWQAVMGSNPSSVKGRLLPVTDVSWEDAGKFIERINTRPGLGLVLPSEAQWEYACRAGTDTAYNFGTEINRKLVNYNGKGSVPVGSLKPNLWGLHEMHGNVEEWCADAWHDNYDGAPADGSAWVDGAAASRVFRGGSWYGVARFVRAASRNRGHPDFRDGHLGFRCARVQRE
jgi:formylglycine-generating enzyme required for sulfatase activity